MRNAMLTIVTAVVLNSAPVWAQIAPVPADQLTDFCRGDLNGDEVVNSADLGSMLGSYGICRGCDEDLNHDGYVDETDVRILAVLWGPCASDEEVITKSSRTVADVSDGPEIYEGDIATNDDVFSDQEPESGRSLTRAFRRSSAAASDQPEINAGDDADDDVFSDQEPVGDKSLTRAYRRSSAAADDQAETVTTPPIYQEPQSGRSLAPAFRRSSATDGDQVETETGDDATDDMLSEQEPQSGRSLARAYRRSSAAADDQVEINTGDVVTNDGAFSDVEQTTCEGDMDRNGEIDTTDLAMLLAKYGRCRGCEEDLNGDGVVNEEDLDILFDIWGGCPRQRSKHVSRSLAASDGDEIEPNLPPQNEPEEVEPQCPGDLDGNGTIGSSDLGMLLAGFGRCNDCEADLNGDGYVDQDDIDELMASWGDCAAETLTDTNPKGKSRAESLSRG